MDLLQGELPEETHEVTDVKEITEEASKEVSEEDMKIAEKTCGHPEGPSETKEVLLVSALLPFHDTVPYVKHLQARTSDNLKVRVCQYDPDKSNVFIEFLHLLKSCEDHPGPLVVINNNVLFAVPPEMFLENCRSFHSSFEDYDVIYLAWWQDRCDWQTLVLKDVSGFSLSLSQRAQNDRAFLLSKTGRNKILQHAFSKEILEKGRLGETACQLFVPAKTPVGSVIKEPPSLIAKTIASAAGFNEQLFRFTKQKVNVVKEKIEKALLTSMDTQFFMSSETALEERRLLAADNSAGPVSYTSPLLAFMQHLQKEKDVNVVVVTPPLVFFDPEEVVAFEEYTTSQLCVLPDAKKMSAESTDSDTTYVWVILLVISLFLILFGLLIFILVKITKNDKYEQKKEPVKETVVLSVAPPVSTEITA